jgi:uncharacterized protein with gpF-like domain
MALLREPDLNDQYQRPYGAPRPVPAAPLAQDAAPRPRKGEKVLPAVHPNVGLEAAYRRRLRALVEEMHRSFDYWLKAAYRRNEPAIAQDEVPAAELQKAIDELTKQWRRRFKEGSIDLAKWFATKASRRSDDALRAILRRSGISVEFQMSPAMRDILRATIEQNVSLIKSIPEQYLTQVQGAVMRSVQTGRDLGSLAKELEEHYGVTRRRAAIIARSQNNLATSSMTAARQNEVGITKCKWLHSHGGKEPRRTHVAESGKEYNPAVGWYDPEAYRVRGGM